MTRLSFPSLIVVTATILLASQAWGKDGSCQFRAGGLSLNFGELDPSNINLVVSKPIVASTTFADMAGDCEPGTMTIAIQGPSSRQLVSGSNTINYTITGLPITLPMPGNHKGSASDPRGYVPWFAPGQLQGVIQWSAYADAPVGNYTDSVTIEVTP